MRKKDFIKIINVLGASFDGENRLYELTTKMTYNDFCMFNHEYDNIINYNHFSIAEVKYEDEEAECYFIFDTFFSNKTLLSEICKDDNLEEVAESGIYSNKELDVHFEVIEKLKNDYVINIKKVIS